jgi:RHS repeat-associated protein
MHNWNADANPTTLNGVGLTYDALGREVEIASGSTYTQVLYSPIGKLGLMKGQSAKTIRIPLPGGSTAELEGATGGTLHILHSDWLGSARLSTTYGNRTMAYDTAYAPYGEDYPVSTGDLNFTGQSQDTLSGLYDFLYREHSPVQGRWISPDPAGLGAVDFSNPQSWNRYAYVNNSPLSNVDPLGLACWPLEKAMWGSCDYFAMLEGAQFGSNWNEFQQFTIAPPGAVFVDGGCWGCTTASAGLLQNQTPQTPQPPQPPTPPTQPPKSPARQQCEANAANKYQNTFNAVDSSFYRDAYKSGLKGVLWGGAAGCALTWEIGCAEGGLPGAVIGGLAGAGKSMWENLGSVGMAYLQYRNEMNACNAIP